MSRRVGLYWFTNDLRVHDNLLLSHATQEADELLCLYCYPCITPFLSHYAQVSQLGQGRQRFIKDALLCLDNSLHSLGQRLTVVNLSPLPALQHAIEQIGVTHLYINASAGVDEQRAVEIIKRQNPHLIVTQKETCTLFTQEQLPFTLRELPNTFTQFRKQVDSLEVSHPRDKVQVMPCEVTYHSESTLSFSSSNRARSFIGGERAGLAHCHRYFSSTFASEYKQTRNELDGMNASTKFSPWLAHGNISPRMVYAMLKRYERDNQANESTYWIYFELLWREYFYWYARKYREALFRFGGIKGQRPLTSYYAHRFQQWKKGETPFPIVNACMHQLNETGYMSNRGRQLVASCLVHELGLDWRYGAAYFESQLIDYDVASNWGNWQYLAGVGADPRGTRQFNLEKQTQMYDPYMEFIDRWKGRCAGAHLDSVDMVDWPIVMDSNGNA
ncbi:DASH family cryptochrome [Vibrio alfacsensis]|uniref:DASH family cryptochrome n=1 Tax=Vibrio alfacsensis TaxID=1074311 RepID=UPI002ADDF1E2|nr:DASH family cryptochrome [Vibrio alfacsensis]WQE77793.1 DASH family cryptochrome [Vibrio alfacsensis]